MFKSVISVGNLCYCDFFLHRFPPFDDASFLTVPSQAPRQIVSLQQGNAPKFSTIRRTPMPGAESTFDSLAPTKKPRLNFGRTFLHGDLDSKLRSLPSVKVFFGDDDLPFDDDDLPSRFDGRYGLSGSNNLGNVDLTITPPRQDTQQVLKTYQTPPPFRRVINEPNNATVQQDTEGTPLPDTQQPTKKKKHTDSQQGTENPPGSQQGTTKKTPSDSQQNTTKKPPFGSQQPPKENPGATPVQNPPPLQPASTESTFAPIPEVAQYLKVTDGKVSLKPINEKSTRAAIRRELGLAPNASNIDIEKYDAEGQQRIAAVLSNYHIAISNLDKVPDGTQTLTSRPSSTLSIQTRSSSRGSVS